MQQINLNPSNPPEWTTYFIGGLNVYTWTLANLAQYCESWTHGPSIPINVVFLVHYRGGDSSYCQEIAQSIETEMGLASPTVPIIYVTFDCRNHGQRLIDDTHNHGWKSGNPSHALDMSLAIDGNVQDLRLIMEWLPLCLDLDRYLPASDSGCDPTISWQNVVMGVSLGAHTTFRFCSEYPQLVRAACPIVGCSDLLLLLVNRLLGQKTHDYKKYFYHEYKELPLSPEQRLLYPKQVHDRISLQDERIFERFPSQISMFVVFGDSDTLVPPHFSKPWADTLAASNQDTCVYVQPGVAHDFTAESLKAMTHWLRQRFDDWASPTK